MPLHSGVLLFVAEGALFATALQYDQASVHSSSPSREVSPAAREGLTAYIANLDPVSNVQQGSATTYFQPSVQDDEYSIEESESAPKSPQSFLTMASQTKEHMNNSVDRALQAAQSLRLPPHWLDTLGNMLVDGLALGSPGESAPPVGGNASAITQSADQADNFLTLASKPQSQQLDAVSRTETEAADQMAKTSGSEVGEAQQLPSFEHLPPPRWFNPVTLFRGTASASTEDVISLAKKRHSIWVHGYGRSGSSTVMTMFSEAWPGEHVFALFEPCHREDQLDEKFIGAPCGEQMRHYTACDFSIARYVHGWDNRRSTTCNETRYSWRDMADVCSRSSALVFKTISHPFEKIHVKRDVIPYLKQDRRMRFIFVIRDPRSIYASMLTTEPFRSRDLGKQHDVKVMTDICDSFASSIEVNHPRMFRLVFEDLVDSPITHMQAAYRFLGVDFGELQMAWVQRTLNASRCWQETGFDKHYRDCHTSWTASRSMQQWKEVLNLTEQAIFLKSGTCRIVAAAYDYSLEFALPS